MSKISKAQGMNKDLINQTEDVLYQQYLRILRVLFLVTFNFSRDFYEFLNKIHNKLMVSKRDFYLCII